MMVLNWKRVMFMPKLKSKFVCQECGYESVKWLGKCPGCAKWNTFVEELDQPTTTRHHLVSETGQKAQRIDEIPVQITERQTTGISECDRVLGGGIVPGSLVLIGGDPGIGKSTLLLQLSWSLAHKGHKVLYVSGEESANQLKLRAERLGTTHSDLYVLAETDLDLAVHAVETIQPEFLIVDSIQTVFRRDLTSAPGSVSQVRECTGVLLRVAKRLNIATFIVGHVTKDGVLAGPRMLEHMVDAVLYFEGERHHMYRILRAVKNRFGSTNELAIFEMKEEGLVEVPNPSEMFLSERTEQRPGSAVVAAIEGSRPLLLEVQALVAPTGFGTPRRMATGADYNRMNMVLAVLERRMGLHLGAQDAYVNVAGGVRIDEPAVDLGIALALTSSFRDRPLAQGDVFIGEVGLTGEVRSVSRLEQRVQEARKLGFTRCFVPAQGLRSWKSKGSIEVIGVASIPDVMRMAF
jgi:DNA repair protein RadA/Sms